MVPREPECRTGLIWGLTGEHRPLLTLRNTRVGSPDDFAFFREKLRDLGARDTSILAEGAPSRIPCIKAVQKGCTKVGNTLAKDCIKTCFTDKPIAGL
jgi:hypothetical protein